MLEADAQWLERWLPGFTQRDRKNSLRAASPFFTTYEMEALLSEGGKFQWSVSGIIYPPKNAGVEVKARGGKVWQLPLAIRRYDYRFEGRRQIRYELSVTVEGLEGVKDINEVELRFLPLL